MKKFFYYLLLALPLGFMTTSCDDDEDKVPNVNIQATISGGVFEDDEIYVVQGEDLVIDGLTLVNNTNKEGTLGAVTYYWDHYLIGTNVTQPFTLTVDTSDQPIGRHLLQAQMPIYVVDYPVCWGYIQYYVNIVADSSELPGNGDVSGDNSTSKVINGIIKTKE
ncbi:MAG: hypothetical protein HDS68_09890 [Bacteroidales bacterium]|nr:hypothetical protein [Bacteroidales bacterium]